MDKNLPSPWDLQTDEIHSDCRIFEVRKQRLKRRSDGVEGDFFVLNTNDWSKRAHWSGRQRIDPNILTTKIDGKIANRGF